jgi:hypothetical protein
MISSDELQQAIALIQRNDWHAAHEIAQSHSDPIANWLHAILHKMEGDVGNSHYWYARTHGVQYEDYADLTQELTAIAKCRK